MTKKDAYRNAGSKLRRIRSGLCALCGLVRGDDGTETLCRPCADKLAETSKAIRDSHAPGECAWCGEAIEDGISGVFCSKHREKNRKNTKDRLQRYREVGLCEKCGKRKRITLTKVSLCEECWLKNCARRFLGDQSKWIELKSLYDSQNGLCAYSGAPITLGVDASLDHILPISRFPVDTPDVSQFKWVNKQVNYMKGTMTIQEWIDTMKLIVSRMEQSHG